MMTTGELSRARGELEHKLKEPFSAERKQQLQTELNAVTAEQTARQKTTGLVPSAWADS